MIGLITNCFTDLSVSVAALFLKISTSPKIETPPDRGGGGNRLWARLLQDNKQHKNKM